jgi:PAS domain S-box-containing protein
MRRFRALADQSPFGVFHTDSRGAVNYCNQPFSEIAGTTPQELQGFGWCDFIHPKDLVRVLSAWKEGVESSRPVELQYRILRKDGSRRHVRLTGRPLPTQAGEEKEFIGVVLDVTEQVVAERKLRRANAVLGAILENIPCGVTVYDARGALVLDNQHVHDFMGQAAAVSAGNSDFGGLFPAREGGVAEEPDTESPWNQQSDREPLVHEETQPDGRVLEVRDAPMPGGGTVTTYTDITQHKQVIESLRQAKAAADTAAAAKAAFLAVMSHEIRTPMNGVIGMTNVLLETPLSPDQRDLLEVIRQSGESLLVILNDVLDYSKIESGEMQVEWAPMRLADIVERSRQLLAGKAREKSIALTYELHPALPELIYGDRTRLQQVLVNLLSNAVKFTSVGNVRVLVSADFGSRAARSRMSTGDMITMRVLVQDTGIGISADKLDRIFQPFVQADSSTARRFGGSGLGLAISKRLVEAMGGEISLRSRPGVGTSVEFSFLAEVAAPDSAAKTEGAVLWGKQVLLVHPQDARYEHLGKLFERWGMSYRHCESAEEALGLLEFVGGFDLVACADGLRGTRIGDFLRSVQAIHGGKPVVLLGKDSETGMSGSANPAVFSLDLSETAAYELLAQFFRTPARNNGVQEPPERQFESTLALRNPLHILVAEDNEINRKVALRMLAGFGYEADVAHNGAQAVQAVAQKRYDLVLMDIQMPEMDGIEATRVIAAMPASERPRIVAMSANVMREDVEEVLRAGATDYVSKPVSTAALRQVLEQTTGAPTRAQSGGDHDKFSLPAFSPEKAFAFLNSDDTGEFLVEIVGTFCSSSLQMIERLRTLILSGDCAAVRLTAHELSGIAAVTGAEQLSHDAHVLERAARNGDLAGAFSHLAHCVRSRNEAAEAMQAFVGRHGGTDLS